MKKYRQALATLRSLNQGAPHDPANVKTPSFVGWMNQPPESPKSIFDEAAVNDVGGEIIALQQELGFEEQDELPGRTALAELFEFNTVPDAAVLSMIEQVIGGDIDAQVGWYKRAGQVVLVQYNVTWTNTVPGLDAVDAKLPLPFEAVVGANIDGSVLIDSNFQGDNASGPFFGVRMANFPTPGRIALVAKTSMGAVLTGIKIGDGDGVGPRQAVLQMSYHTTGVRNTDWPSASFTEWTGVHTPLGTVGSPTILNWRVDGAQPGDNVQLYREGVLVPGSAFPVVNTPKERGQFVLSNFAPEPFPGDFTVELNGFHSRPYTVT